MPIYYYFLCLKRIFLFRLAKILLLFTLLYMQLQFCTRCNDQNHSSDHGKIFNLKDLQRRLFQFYSQKIRDCPLSSTASLCVNFVSNRCPHKIVYFCMQFLFLWDKASQCFLAIQGCWVKWKKIGSLNIRVQGHEQLPLFTWIHKVWDLHPDNFS